MRVAAALAVFTAAAFMLYGWGWAAGRVLRSRSASWPTTAAYGMAAVVFLGGVLNLARLAFPWALACLALAGIALGALALFKDRPKLPDARELSRFLLPLLVLIFVILTQVPPQAYNFHDDFQKYFVHPVRMLETGTVFGSPLNDIGLDTLGGQAFLDGFSVAFFPIQYLNGVGAAFGLFLCLMVATQFKSILATLSVVVINPQYVNTSALYTGSLLMMAVLIEGGAVQEECSAALTGLLYAALMALKGTFLLFVALHLIAAAFVLGIKRAAQFAAFAALFLAPWILLHAPHYVHLLNASLGITEHGVRPHETFNIFSGRPLDYGSPPIAYTSLMLAVGLCGAMLARLKGRVDLTAASCFATVAAYLVMVYISGPRNAGYDQAIRYFAPFAIGVAPVAFGAAWLAFEEHTDYRWIVAVVAAVPLLTFLPSLRDRAEQAVHSGSVLAFSWLAPEPEYIAYSQEVLYGDMRARVAAAQAKVPAGEPAVAWINAPFYLNFKRNPLADVEPGAGLIAPWSQIPPGTRYFIFQYAGYANMDDADYLDMMAEGPDFMRRVSAARLKMGRLLNQKMQASPKLYDDGEIAVYTAADGR